MANGSMTAKDRTMLKQNNADRHAGSIQNASLSAFFSYGFRPFFLGAAAFSSALMLVWLCWIASVATGGDGAWLRVAGSPHAWHAHEMLLGFATAAIAGFLLTAVPNWTGALPLSGAPLIILFALWLAGRVVMAGSAMLPYELVALVDAAFLPALGAFAARQLLVKPAPRNLVLLLVLAAIMVGNVAYHLEIMGHVSYDPMRAIRGALLGIAVLLAIIGGRIVPAFTQNWLHLNAGDAPMPRRIASLDLASILSIVTLLVLTAGDAPLGLVGAVAALGAFFNGVRLALWRGWTTRSEPIVWVLHAGYFWLVAGLALYAAAALTPAVPISLGSHALSTGAIGTMVLGIMSRASLGHTGRPIRAPRPIVWSYLLATLAAALRVLGPLAFPEAGPLLLIAAALAWIAAFAIFAVTFAPILATPRVYTKVTRE